MTEATTKWGRERERERSKEDKSQSGREKAGVEITTGHETQERGAIHIRFLRRCNVFWGEGAAGGGGGGCVRRRLAEVGCLMRSFQVHSCGEANKFSVFFL